jgi:hypothetical protein
MHIREVGNMNKRLEYYNEYENVPTALKDDKEPMSKEEIISHEYPDAELLLADGFGDAIIGVGSQFNNTFVIYDYEKCIHILRGGYYDRGWIYDTSREDAEEYMEFNVTGAYVGESTPCFVKTI